MSEHCANERQKQGRKRIKNYSQKLFITVKSKTVISGTALCFRIIMLEKMAFGQQVPVKDNDVKSLQQIQHYQISEEKLPESEIVL